MVLMVDPLMASLSILFEEFQVPLNETEILEECFRLSVLGFFLTWKVCFASGLQSILADSISLYMKAF